MSVRAIPQAWSIEYDNADSRSGGQWWTVGDQGIQVWIPYGGDAEAAAALAERVAQLPLLERDAARYRLLRQERRGGIDVKLEDRHLYGESLDTEVDAVG